ncbi:hypothetical protein JCM3775_003608 [Rhodotorula graminis]
MARRDSKSWRRSRTLSTAFLSDSAPTKGSSLLSRLRLRAIAPPALVALAVVACLVLLRAGTTSAPPPSSVDNKNTAHAAQHPNFDFDAHIEQHAAPGRVLGEDDDDTAAGEVADEDEAGTAEEAVEDIDGEGEDETDEVDGGELPAPRPGTSLAPPFLPFTCDDCSSASARHPSAPVCAKYRGTSPSSSSTSSSSSAHASPHHSGLHPDILDHSVLFAGTGAEVRRVLKRAMRSSLWAAKRAREGTEEDVQRAEGEEPFRILVLGGSVSNCRGVDPKTTCWHAHVLRWFQKMLPMEGDRDLVPDQPSLLVPQAESLLPIVQQRERARRSTSPPPPEDAPLAPAPPHADTAHLVARALSPKHKTAKKKKKKKANAKAGASKGRRRPSTKLINGSKSATGSAFFAFCFDEEMTLRRKNVDWGLGPDLVLLETGVNDVWPGGERATRDFEKLLRTLRTLPSQPAVIALEAASLLLASTTSMASNAEYDHLPAAHFYDVPVLSVKQALFGSVAGLSPPPPPSSTSDAVSLSSSPDSTVTKIDDLFLPDLHHPNERGHELLADVLISFLEQQACVAQSELLAIADDRIRSTPPRLLPTGTVADDQRVDPSLDFLSRKAEPVRPLPARSLFTPFAFDKKGRKKADKWWDLPAPRCIQVGNAKTTVEPVQNRGWTKLAWARDKQYLVADTPGASVTFRVEVGAGGAVMADWLHSRFYDLGDVSVYLDGDKAKAAKLAGYWDLGWSIGVPTEVFTGVAPGPHDVTFEVLAASESSHPSRKTNFRLIGLITT